MEPADLVQRVIALGIERLDEALELLHPDAVWVPDRDRPPLRGREEIANFVAAELERLEPDVPEPLTTSLTAQGDTVLVYGQLRVPHTGGRRFVEMQPIAWVYEVEDGRVARVTIYRTWEEARAAAGIAPGTPPTRRFRNWQLALGFRRSALGVT
jgi:ketosteroid isomerase-like protein